MSAKKIFNPLLKKEEIFNSDSVINRGFLPLKATITSKVGLYFHILTYVLNTHDFVHKSNAYNKIKYLVKF